MFDPRLELGAYVKQYFSSMMGACIRPCKACTTACEVGIPHSIPQGRNRGSEEDISCLTL